MSYGNIIEDLDFCCKVFACSHYIRYSLFFVPYVHLTRYYLFERTAKQSTVESHVCHRYPSAIVTYLIRVKRAQPMLFRLARTSCLTHLRCAL